MKGAKRKQRQYQEPLGLVHKFYPGARSTMYHGFPAYRVSRKVFVFYVSSTQAVVRLPRRRVEFLSENEVGTVFGTSQGWWYEWLVLDFHSDHVEWNWRHYFDEAYWYALGRKRAELLPWWLISPYP